MAMYYIPEEYIRYNSAKNVHIAMGYQYVGNAILLKTAISFVHRKQVSGNALYHIIL